MPFNGSGIYSPPSPEFPAVAGNVIYSAEFNTIITDIATALAKALLIDGQNQMAANLKLNGFKVTGMDDGTADTDGATVGQLNSAIAGVSTDTLPAGIITPWLGGYFTDGSNAGFTSVLGNTVATANSYLNPKGWYVCNGATLNDSNSTIFNGANRYLPNLSDDRFIQGSTIGGGSGGSSTSDHTHTLSHTHTVDIGAFSSGVTAADLAPHSHSLGNGIAGISGSGGPFRSAYGGVLPGELHTEVAGSGGGHTHTIDPPAATSSGASTSTTSAASATENRPKFLSCLYIMKVI